MTEERLKEIEWLQQAVDVAYDYVPELVAEVRRLRVDLEFLQRQAIRSNLCAVGKCVPEEENASLKAQVEELIDGFNRIFEERSKLFRQRSALISLLEAISMNMPQADKDEVKKCIQAALVVGK